MKPYQLTDESFLKDVDQHVMEVIHEDGVFRHLRFKRPGTVCMHFDLITWPGRLCYTGDMGTFVFSRVHDMLTFFRPDAYAKEAPLKRIDRRYWAERSTPAAVTASLSSAKRSSTEQSLSTWSTGFATTEPTPPRKSGANSGTP